MPNDSHEDHVFVCVCLFLFNSRTDEQMTLLKHGARAAAHRFYSIPET